MRCAAAAAEGALLKMARTLRRNASAPVSLAACLVVWLGAGLHPCVALKAVGSVAAGDFQWDRTAFWTVDQPPKVDFLPEDEEFIRVARPGAKPASPKPPATTTRRRILWLSPDDGHHHVETNPADEAAVTRRLRRAAEKTVVPDRGLQDWLGIPGPPSGNQVFDTQTSKDIDGYANSFPATNLYKDDGKPSNFGYPIFQRGSDSPGLSSSLDVDATVVPLGEERQKLNTTLLAKMAKEPEEVTENRERKLQNLTTLVGISISHAPRHGRSSTRTINSLEKSESRQKIGGSTVLKHEDLPETDNESLPVEAAVGEQHMKLHEPSISERSLHRSFAGGQENQDGLATSNDGNQDTGKQRHIGRRLLGISSEEAAPSPAEDAAAVGDAGGEMTKEEEAAVRERLVQDIVGDLLGVDGSGDGSGWGEVET